MIVPKSQEEIREIKLRRKIQENQEPDFSKKSSDLDFVPLQQNSGPEFSEKSSGLISQDLSENSSFTSSLISREVKKNQVPDLKENLWKSGSFFSREVKESQVFDFQENQGKSGFKATGKQQLNE